MQQYECENCGYDMTGIQNANVADGLSFAPYEGYYGDNSLPLSLTATASNSMTCRNCGNVGNWIKK